MDPYIIISEPDNLSDLKIENTENDRSEIDTISERGSEFGESDSDNEGNTELFNYDYENEDIKLTDELEMIETEEDYSENTENEENYNESEDGERSAEESTGEVERKESSETKVKKLSAKSPKRTKKVSKKVMDERKSMPKLFANRRNDSDSLLRRRTTNMTKKSVPRATTSVIKELSPVNPVVAPLAKSLAPTTAQNGRVGSGKKKSIPIKLRLPNGEVVVLKCTVDKTAAQFTQYALGKVKVSELPGEILLSLRSRT